MACKGIAPKMFVAIPIDLVGSVFSATTIPGPATAVTSEKCAGKSAV